MSRHAHSSGAEGAHADLTVTTRYDVSGVPLQGGYVAKHCPVRAQWDAVHPAEPVPPDPFTQRLMDHGVAFEAEVMAEIDRLHPDALVIAGDDANAREVATAAAMRGGASPILNSRLASDLKGRRVGRPDLLVAAAAGGYRAVDVKWHQSLLVSTGKPSELSGLCAELRSLRQETAVVDATVAARRHEGDMLQLAHYQRMLEAFGFAAEGRRWGGIIGTERRVVWYDLDAPIWRTPSSTGKTKLRSTMERYDFEFDFRLDIVAVAQEHLADQAVKLLVVPVRCSECPTCPWNDVCRPLLEAGAGDVSLLPRIGWLPWKIHQDHGVIDRAALAALDCRTASFVASGIDLATWRARAAGHADQTPVLDLANDRRSIKELEKLREGGIATVADLVALDAKTAAYSCSGLTALPEHIDQARAALGTDAVYMKRGVSKVGVRRADIEVDVDMENSEVGVYLWGTLLTDRTGPQPRSEYRSFHTWDELTPEREAANSLEFWTWLVSMREEAQDRGLTFAAYCYNAGAENQYLRRLGLAADLVDEVQAFIASSEWIDLLRAWDEQLITGHSSGLKTVATLIGISWGVDDPGGGESMVKYDDAVAGDKEARRWLLEYNCGDVKATLALREWMQSATLRSVEVLAAQHGRGT